MLLELDVFGDVQVRRKLLRFGDRARDARPAFELMADDLREWEERQFASEGGFASGGWDPLAPSTIAAKAAAPRAAFTGSRTKTGKFAKRVRRNRRILEDTGALRESLTQHGDAEHVELIFPQEFVFGSTVPYAQFHQRGT